MYIKLLMLVLGSLHGYLFGEIVNKYPKLKKIVDSPVVCYTLTTVVTVLCVTYM